MSKSHDLIGRCHCGNIGFAFGWPGGRTIPVRACQCSFCVKHGGAYTSHPEGSLHIAIKDRTKAEVYRFGTGTADFHLCRACGVVPVVTSEIDGTRYGVINVNTLEDIDRRRLESSDTDFAGEGTDDRLARRVRNWVPNVTIA